MTSFFERTGIQFFAEGEEGVGDDEFVCSFDDDGEQTQQDDDYELFNEQSEQYINIPFRGQSFSISTSELDRLNEAFGGNLADILKNGLGLEQNSMDMQSGAELLRPFEEFLKQYPDVDISSLDTDFFKLVDTGIHPSAVYERLQAQKEIEGYKNQIAAMNKNIMNSCLSIGSMESSEVESDAFLNGFMR